MSAAPGPSENRRGRLGFVLPCIAHVVALLLIAAILPGPNGSGNSIFWVALGLGILHGQAALLAVWTTFGNGGLVRRRIPIAVFLLSLMTFALTAYVVRTDGPASIGLSGGAVMLVQWGLIQAPLWYARRKGCWRLERTALSPAIFASPSEDTQFGIVHLMLWTAGVGVLLTIGRLLFHASGVGEAQEWLINFALFMIFNVLLAVPLLWLMLARRMPVAAWILILLAVSAATAAEAWLFHAKGGRGAQLDATFLSQMNAVYLAVIVASLLAIRRRGWRWCKLPATAS